MFFMLGITEGRKNLDYNQVFVCNICGAYGRYVVYVTYTVLSLFFLPVFKWNRRYFVTTTCCNTTYQLNGDAGKRIEHGEQVEIRPEDLQKISGGGYAQNKEKRCMNCGYATMEDFSYCPRCGQLLKK
ncbi:MAG: zinc ribbon domain-containing protein [Eubacteriales bacterium]|nr:zinc ribbon domain-containing protein [Eubacteriales bacterium]